MAHAAAPSKETKRTGRRCTRPGRPSRCRRRRGVGGPAVDDALDAADKPIDVLTVSNDFQIANVFGQHEHELR
eukprot:2575528-Pyramimonas_sp.AAC.1